MHICGILMVFMKDKSQIYSVSVGDANTAQEPAVAYLSAYQVIRAIREGISREQLQAFCKQIHRSLAELATILPVSYSLLTKRDSFDTQVSEHVMELTTLFTLGISIFGEPDRFNAWLDSPAPQLDGLRPFEVLDTHYGIRYVTDWLHRIDHGLPA